MKKILGLLTALLLASPVMADDAAVSSNDKGSAWIVMDDEIWFCHVWDTETTEPVCYKAEMRD